jgi:hypothetical protein
MMLGLSGPAIAGLPSGPLTAGAAKVDISPAPQDLSAEDREVYAGVHDPLFARALILSNGTSKVALISVDSSGFPDSQRIIDEVAAALHMPAENVLLTDTRVHNAPATGLCSRCQLPAISRPLPPYWGVLERGILAAARQADENRQPARIGFGTGKAYVNANREQRVGDRVIVGFNPDGPSDKTVAVLEITDSAGKPIAIYSTYAVHGIVMFGAKSRDGKQEITADLAGAVVDLVESHFPGAVALYTMSAGGDQNPLFSAVYGEGGPNGQRSPDDIDVGAGGWALIQLQGRRLGQEIVRVTQGIQTTSGDAVLWGAVDSPSCPANPRGMGVGAGGDPVALGSGPQVGIPLSVLIINDITVAAIGGDLFTSIATHVKQASLFKKFMWAAMLNTTISNIPADSDYLPPQPFEAQHSVLKPGCAQGAITNSILRMQRRFQALNKP